MRYHFCGQDGHLESKCFKNMEALNVGMKKYNISLDSSSSNEWFIDSRESYHMVRDKAIFYAHSECNTKQICVGDDRSLNVVGSRRIHVDNGLFNDVLCVPSISYNLLSVYHITLSVEGKTIDFSPHQVVIKDLKYLKHVLATKIVDDITGCTSLTTLGHHLFHQFLFLIAMT